MRARRRAHRPGASTGSLGTRAGSARTGRRWLLQPRCEAVVNVCGYIRLSKAENGHGLQVKRKAVEEFCRRRGLTLAALYEDNGASGRSTRKRPGLHSALEACRSGEVAGIVGTRVDRLCRSSLDFHKIVEEVQKANATILFTEQESFSLDTAEGRM